MTTDESVPIRISELRPTPDAENPNVMDDASVARLAESIRQKGFLQPILISPRAAADGFLYDIIDGEHRRRAMVLLGEEFIPAVIRPSTPEEIVALRLGMNRNRGEVDLTIARAQVRDLVHDGWSTDELAITGFSSEELDALMAAAAPNALLAEDVGGTHVADEADVAPKPFVLEIAFGSKAQMALAKRKLLKASGATKDLGLGLLNVLGEES